MLYLSISSWNADVPLKNIVNPDIVVQKKRNTQVNQEIITTTLNVHVIHSNCVNYVLYLNMDPLLLTFIKLYPSMDK